MCLQEGARSNLDAVSFDPAGHVLTATNYDSLHHLIGTTSNAYDDNGNLVRSEDADGNYTLTTYNAEQQVASVQTFDADDTLVESATRFYDEAGRLVETQDANGRSTYFAYDAAGNQTSVTDPTSKVTTSSFDLSNNLTSVTDPNGNAVSYGYDAAGNKTSETDGAGHLTSFGYDPAGNLVQVIDPDGNVTKYTRDALGNQLTMVVGTLSTIDDPNLPRDVRTYDGDGKLTMAKDRLGRVRRIVYAGNQIQEKWFVDDQSTIALETLTFNYDHDGNLTSASSSAGTYTMSYDDNRLTRQIDPNGVTLDFLYDAAGNVTSMTDSAGTVTSAYDGNGNLTRRTFSGPGGQLRIDLAYDDNGNLATVTRHGTGQSLVGSSAFGYDLDQRLTGLTQRNGAGAVLANYVYSYDFGGRLTSETDNNATPTGYSYDGASQLTQADSESFGYDPNGNRNAGGFQVGQNNQLTTDGTWNYAYDVEGDLIGKTDPATGDSWAYTYDYANHMTSAVEMNGTTTVLVANYAYDVFGNRLSETVTQNGTTTVTSFAFVNPESDVPQIWTDLNGDGSLATRYVAGDQPDQWFARVDAAGTVGWYLTDHLGSIRAITDNSGQVIDHLDYDAFGNVTNETHPEVGGRLKFQGGEWDPETGTYRFNDRNLIPQTDQWMEEDRTGFGAGDSNLRRAMGNHPSYATDPSGLQEAQNGNHPSPPVRPKSNSPESISMAFQSGKEFAQNSPDVSFEKISETIGDKLYLKEYQAFILGYRTAKLAMRPQEVKERLDEADKLERVVDRMHLARIRKAGNLLLVFGSEDAMSNEEADLRNRIYMLRSPLYELHGEKLAGSNELKYFDYGPAGYQTNHALISPPLTEDPIVMVATLGSGVLLRGGGLFTGGTISPKVAASNAVKGAAIGVAVNVGDQSVRIAGGHQAGYNLNELGPAALSGLVAGATLSVFPGLTVPGFVWGLGPAVDAIGQGQPLTAAFRATFALFGPKVSQRLLGLGKTFCRFGKNDLVLGLNPEGRLKGITLKYGGKTYGEFEVPRGSFDRQIRSAMNQADMIRFDLTDVMTSRASGELNAFGEPVHGYTNYELYLIKNNPQYLSKTTWFENGVERGSPF